jgi:hypothetical protein
VLTIQFFGGAAGHIYFWVVENNTKPYNFGVPLWTDIALPKPQTPSAASV